jgi:N-methylhydantoinase B
VLLKQGAAVRMRFPGGGGFGDPLARDPALVRADVQRGLVSADRARSDYGVALGPDLEVDREATARLRAARS